jgi:hypothetical protein
MVAGVGDHLRDGLLDLVDDPHLAPGAHGDLADGGGDLADRPAGLVGVGGHLARRLAQLAGDVAHGDERVAHRGLELRAVIREVVVGLVHRDLPEVEAHRREGVVLERLHDRLDVEVEGDDERALGPGAHGGPVRERLAQVLAGQVEVSDVAAEVPLEREVDGVVQLADAQAALEVGGAELAAAGGLGEDLAQVAGLRLLERGARSVIERPLRFA